MPRSMAISVSATTNDFNNCVAKIFIGITSSYELIGTIALLPPPIDVLKINSLGFIKDDKKQHSISNVNLIPASTNS